MLLATIALYKQTSENFRARPPTERPMAPSIWLTGYYLFLIHGCRVAFNCKVYFFQNNFKTIGLFCERSASMCILSNLHEKIKLMHVSYDENEKTKGKGIRK